MRGGPFHEHMLSEIEARLCSAGCQTRNQVASRKGRDTGYVDLMAVCPNQHKLIVEIEMTTRRIGNDIRKRMDFGANSILWIVAPNKAVKKAIDGLVQTGYNRSLPGRVCVFTFSAAIRVILDKKHFCFCGIGQKQNKKQNSNSSAISAK